MTLHRITLITSLAGLCTDPHKWRQTIAHTHKKLFFSLTATLAFWLIKNIVLSRIRTLMWPKCASFQKRHIFFFSWAHKFPHNISSDSNFDTHIKFVSAWLILLFFSSCSYFFHAIHVLVGSLYFFSVHYSFTMSCHVTWPNVDSCFTMLCAPLLLPSVFLSLYPSFSFITGHVPLQVKFVRKSIHLIEFSQVLPSRVRKVNKNLFFPLS